MQTEDEDEFEVDYEILGTNTLQRLEAYRRIFPVWWREKRAKRDALLTAFAKVEQAHRVDIVWQKEQVGTNDPH